MATSSSRCRIASDLIKTKQFNALVPNESVAMALVMHFVGDIHQPLHTTGRYDPETHKQDDAGGNGVTVANLADTPWPNLHTFWDEAYRRYYENGEVKAMPRLNEADAPGSPEIEEWMKRLDLNVPEKLDTHFDAKKWALEGHEIACTQVYGTLGEPYGAKDIKLKEEYVKQGTRTARASACRCWLSSRCPAERPVREIVPRRKNPPRESRICGICLWRRWPG